MVFYEPVVNLKTLRARCQIAYKPASVQGVCNICVSSLFRLCVAAFLHCISQLGKCWCC